MPSLVETYYLANLMFTVGYTLAIIVVLGRYTPDNPTTRAFERYLICVVAWAFFDAATSRLASILPPESSFFWFRVMSFLWVGVPAAGLELMRSLMGPITWRFRAAVYIPFALFYPVGLIAPDLVSPRHFINPGGFLDPFGPWYKAFMAVTLVLSSWMLVRLGLSSLRDHDSSVRKEKQVLMIGGWGGIIGQGIALWLRGEYGPDFPLLGNLLVAPVVIAAFFVLQRYGRVLSPRSLYKSTVEVIPSGIALLREARIMWANDSLAKMLAVANSGALVGHKIEEFLPRQEPDEETSQEIQLLTSLDRIRDKEVSLVNRDGDTVRCLLNLLPLDARDPTQGAVLSFTDLTRLKEVQRDLERSLAISTELRIRAEAASRAKSEFLANMSHELRTPLNAVIGFSEILEDQIFGKLNEKQVRYVGHILSGGRHLLRVINDILDLAKVESGKVELRVTEVDVGRLLEECFVMIKEESQRRSLSTGLYLAGDVAGLKIRADEVRLRQVVFNLLSNAVKFTPRGGEVKLAAKRTRDHLQISVTDTGIGVRQENLQRIFGAFEQVDSSYSREQQGTGLGLAVARSLVELHGGSIWAESKGEGQGTTFNFLIPIGVTLATTALDEKRVLM